MGYRRPKHVYKLVFEDEDMGGLEVRTTSPSLGQFLELAKLAELDVSDPTAVTSSDLEQVRELFEMFAEYLVSWNLEDEGGQPVPSDLSGLMLQDIGFIMRIILAWMKAIAGVSGPKERPSSGGGPFPEGSLPMEPLSASPPSSSTPSSSSAAANDLAAFRAS